MASLAELKKQNQPQDQQVQRRPKTIFDFLTGDKKIESAIAAVATNFLTPDRFLRLAVNAVKKTPLLMQCDPQSVLGAFMTSAALGLEPNTIMQQAFLIPYKKRARIDGEWVDIYECNFQVGARGFVTLAHRSPHIDTLEAEAIHEGDHFKHMKGSKSFLEYEKTLKARGEMIGAFCFTKMASGAEMATVLPLDEILKIRGRSETFNALTRNLANADSDKERDKAQQKLDETPWVMWADDMAAKSAIKKHAKQLPLSPDDAMAAATKLDSDDGKIIDMATMADPDMVREVMKQGADAVDLDKAGASSAPMLEQNESQRMSQNIRSLREAESVDATYTEREPAQQQRQQRTGPTTDEVRGRLNKATDTDMLDADADLIREVPLEDQQGLTELYRERREALENPITQQRPRPQPRGQMSIE